MGNKKLFSSVILVSFIAACKVDKPRCEKWEVKFEKFNIAGCIDWSCGGSRTVQLNYCDEALQGVNAGNTKVLSQDACCKHTVTYIRKI